MLLIVSPTGQGFLNHEGVKSCSSAGKNTKTAKIVFLRGLVRVCLNFVVFAVPYGEKAPRAFTRLVWWTTRCWRSYSRGRRRDDEADNTVCEKARWHAQQRQLSPRKKIRIRIELQHEALGHRGVGSRAPFSP